MKNWHKLILGVLIFTGCRKPYNPPAITAPGSYLVVEGVIDSGSDSTIIKLSHTVKLSNITAVNPVKGAILAVESDQSNVYVLTERSPGVYVFPGLNLDASKKYRLSIKTTDGQQYLSDFVPVKNSPPVDSVTYRIKNNGIEIYVNAHDPNNSTRYYRWDYLETWRFHSVFNSFWKSNGDTVLLRDVIHDQIYTCWRSDTPGTIVVASSAKLARDVIAANPITFVPSTSIKLGNEYSVLVRQYALSADAYSFWQNLKTTSEQLGSIFDAQPSQINGNIHCITNPSQPVIGYVSVGAVSSNRLFVFNRDLPAWPTVKDVSNCDSGGYLYQYHDKGGIIINQVNQNINYNKGAIHPLIPIEAIFPKMGLYKVLGFTAADSICVDCTMRGTNKQPSYWKYQ